VGTNAKTTQRSAVDVDDVDSLRGHVANEIASRKLFEESAVETFEILCRGQEHLNRNLRQLDSSVGKLTNTVARLGSVVSTVRFICWLLIVLLGMCVGMLSVLVRR
jgi:hypothetical protein